MTKIPYTPEQIAGKFIVCSKIRMMQKSVFATVTDRQTGHPYLYNSIQAAESDKYFDRVWDEILPASEYFQRIAQKDKSDSQVQKSEYQPPYGNNEYDHHQW